MKTALTIAGSDSSGGAGIQADIKTMTAHGVYAMSAITALTAQNTTGVTGIMEVTPSFLKEQLDDIFTDIFPDAVKSGWFPPAADRGHRGQAGVLQGSQCGGGPVMVSTSGSRLISGEAIEALKEVLLPMANLLTPNIPEAEVLSGMEIHNPGDMEKAARAIGESYAAPYSLRAATSSMMPMICCTGIRS